MVQWFIAAIVRQYILLSGDSMVTIYLKYGRPLHCARHSVSYEICSQITLCHLQSAGVFVKQALGVIRPRIRNPACFYRIHPHLDIFLPVVNKPEHGLG